MQRAISPAMAPSSAAGDSSAPGVSMIVTSGRPSSSARRMPRRASRRAAAPSGFSVSGAPGPDPTRTHGCPSSRVSVTSTAASCSPSSVPFSARVPAAPYLSTSRTPSRDSDRVSSTDSQTGRLDQDWSDRTGSAGSVGGSTSTARVLSISTGRSSVDTTASITPFSARFSARWTPAGNGRPSSAS